MVIKRNEKKIFLHIGTGKTGTTALQRFFLLNRRRLAESGVLYPQTGRWGIEGHHKLFWALAGIRPDTETETPSKILEKLFTEISGFKGDNILISCEAMYGFSDIAKVLKCFEDYHLTIVVYLRRHDYFLPSLASQAIKGHMCYSGTVDEFIDGLFKRETRSVDYYGGLSEWRRMLPDADFIVRPYEKQQFYGGSIFFDFLFHAFNLPIKEGFRVPTKKINVKYGRDILELKRLINLLPMNLGSKTNFAYSLENYNQRLKLSDCSEEYGWLSPKQKIDLLNSQKDSYRKVAKFFLQRKNGQLFYEKLPSVNEKWAPFERLTDQKIVGILHQAISRNPSLINLLRDGVVHGRNSQNKEISIAANILSKGVANLGVCALCKGYTLKYYDILRDNLERYGLSMLGRI